MPILCISWILERIGGHKRMRQRSVKVNVLLNAVRSTLDVLFPLITFPYVTRILDVEMLGKYSFSDSYVYYFSLIAALGITTYAVREGAKYRDDKGKLGGFSSEIFSINVMTSAVSYLLLAVTVLLSGKLREYLWFIIICSIKIGFKTIGTEWLYRIEEDFAYITVRGIVFKVLGIILLFSFVRKPEDGLQYAAVMVFAEVASNLLNFIHAKKYCKIKFTFCVAWKRHIVPMFVLFASSIVQTIYVNSDIIVLGFLENDYVVGIYSVAVKIYSTVKAALAAIIVAYEPRAAYFIGKNEMKAFREMFQEALTMVVTALCPAVAGIICLCREMILLVAGADYLQAELSVKLLSLALLMSIMAWVYKNCVMIPSCQDRVLLVAGIVSGVANVVLNFLLIPFFQEKAAALTTILSEGIMLGTCMFWGRKIVRPNILKRDFCSVVAGCAAIALICVLARTVFDSLKWRLAVGIFGSCTAYFLVLVLCRNSLIGNLFRKLQEISYRRKA